MNKTLVNKDVLKSLTKDELLEKHQQYLELGERENNGSYFFDVAAVYLKEHDSRTA